MPIAMFMAIMGMMYLGAMAFSSASIQKSRDDIASAANSMGVYHAMAARQCTAPNDCGTGRVAVQPMPGTNLNMGVMNSKFASYSDGNYVVTVLTPSYANKLGGDALVFNNSLAKQSSTSVLAGPYTPSQMAAGSDYTHQIVMQPNGSREMETGLLSSRLRSIPPSVGGLTLTAGMPIIATPLYH